MKAKELLRCLVKSGMLSGEIVTKDMLSDWKVIDGKLISGKEYFYTFEKVAYINHSVIMETPCFEKVYLYQI